VSYSYQIPKRFTDLNPGNHVDHGALIDYLQEARTEFLLGGPDPMPAMLGNGVFVTGHHVHYLAPVRYSTSGVDAEVWVDQVGGAKFSISYLLSDAGRPVARARTFLTPYDLQAGALRRLTPAERERMTAVLGEPVPVEPLGRVRTDELADARATSCRVRWADLDSYRHVNNVRYFDYFSQARLQLIAEAGPLDPGEPWMVVRQDVDYRIALDFRREPYQVRTAVTEIGDSSVAFVADISDPLDSGKRSFATARTVMVHLGVDGRAQAIPAATRTVLGSAIAPAP
jgi:acyl-CoA thioester hydrolase